MKITIKSSDGPKIKLPVPANLLLRFLAKDETAQTPPQSLRKVTRALRCSKKILQGESLVEIHSADGDHIIIQL